MYIISKIAIITVVIVGFLNTDFNKNAFIKFSFYVKEVPWLSIEFKSRAGIAFGHMCFHLASTEIIPGRFILV